MVKRSKPPKGQTAEGEPRAGYLVDFISGRPVRATPEEKGAVQLFARRLVEDYGYPKSHIATHPQHRVRKAPSDESKSYPIDIGVFRAPGTAEADLFMVVECKQKNRKEGVEQLRLYLDMSAAEIGVWFNGDEHEYVRKVLHPDGSRTWQALPNIPRFGQRVEDIGLYKRKDLKKPSNLKAVFRDLRNHLAGMTTGITRDEALAQEIITILFCKIWDEQETEPEETVAFRAGVGEEAEDVRARILKLFENVLVDRQLDVFDPKGSINLDADSLRYVVGELQTYCITEADRDAIGEAFEVFIGPALRGAEGQFFTPRNVVSLMVGAVAPQVGEKAVDPACGSGGFLISAVEYVWGRLREEARRKKWTERQLLKRETEAATNCFRGIDKDAFLARVCKAYMALIGDGRGGVFCANSLAKPEEWPAAVREKVKLGTFDVVLTNPPFGAKIVVKGKPVLSQYRLAHKWKQDRETGEWEETAKLPEKRPPQIVFLERCLQLLKPGGRLGIVLPESVLGNPSYEYVVAHVLKHCTVLMVATMPESLFKTSGKGGTHTKVCTLLLKKEPPPLVPYDIFMAEAKWCGHDSRGNRTVQKLGSGEEALLDDTPAIMDRYKKFVAGEQFPEGRLGFVLRSDRIRNRILIPRYYNPEVEAELTRLGETHDLMRVGDLVADKTISVKGGTEVGKMAYGTGTIPFIRTSDISNWELKIDFKHGVSAEVYEAHRRKAHAQAGDILLVRDGTYLIGATAMVTPGDLPMLFQSHVIRIRVLKEEAISPWLLFACLNAPVVKRQVRAKQFTQDIIDTLGKRLLELVLPVPRDAEARRRVAEETRRVIETRAQMRKRAKEIALEVEGAHRPSEDDAEVLRWL